MSEQSSSGGTSPDDYTGPSAFVHLHSHTVFSTLDGVALPSQYAEQCYLRGYPAMAATEHGHMGSVPDMYLAFKKYGLKAIPSCFLPGQPVLTPTGVAMIDHIRPGELIITDKNRPCTVRNTQERDYDGEVVRIKAWGVEEIVATPDHPFLVREVTRSETKRGCWSEQITLGMRPASDLFREKYHRTGKRRYRFYLAAPRLQAGSGYNQVDVAKHARSLQNVPALLSVDEELLWITGLWLAGGTARHGELSFRLGADKFHFYERIAEYFANFGISTSFYYRKKFRALNVNVHSICFSDLFPALFGKGYAAKRISWDMLTMMTAEQSRNLLVGLFDGDAKIACGQSYLKLNNQSLAWQARLLLSRLGQYSAITPVSCDNSGNLNYILHRRETGYYDYDEQYMFLPVGAVGRGQYVGKVYNMEVEEDNTYNVGVAVHNCEIYFNDYEPERAAIGADFRKLKAADPVRYERLARNRHLTVLAMNEAGYHNLLKLTTQAYRTGFYYRPRIWYDKLLEFKEGLLILSGCLNGPVCHELRRTDPDGGPAPVLQTRDRRGAIDWVKRFKKDFGVNYAIELQMPGIPGDLAVFHSLVDIADHYKLPIVLANDAHYLTREDYDIQTVMMAIDQGVPISSDKLWHVNSSEQFMKTRAELWATYRNGGYDRGLGDRVFETACDNTLMIAERCEKLSFDATPKIPSFDGAEEKLCQLVAQKLRQRGLDKVDRRYLIDGAEVTYVEQAAIELERIINKGFASYFLITNDLIGYGLQRGWPFSPRGSASGCLVCHLLGISRIDPLPWGLSFDRFLSPSRGGFMLKTQMPTPVGRSK